MRNKKSLCILLYHGVTKAKSRGIENYSNKHLPAGRFIKEIKWLKNNCNILSMDQVVYHIKRRSEFPPKSVAVTFDDGFENNYTVAAPILADFKIPATFYIPTGFVDTKKMFWVDQLEDCLNRTCRRTLKLPCFPGALSIKTNSDKIKALIRIKDYCKRKDSRITEKIVNQLIEGTGIRPEVGDCLNYKKIKWGQLNRLNRDPLFTIGGHSHNHCILSRISSAELGCEINESLSLLKNNLKQPVRHYSYPEGQRGHYNKFVINKLRTEGIVCCPSAIYGLNSIQSNLFHLKRIMVGFMGIPFVYGLVG